MFGLPTTTPSLFGTTSSTTPSSGTSSLFGNTTGFGGAGTQQPAPAAAAPTFGGFNFPSSTTTQPATTSLFGTSSPSTSTLFGTNVQPIAPTSSAGAAAPGGFTFPSSTGQPTSSLFGTSAATAPTTSLFGTSTLPAAAPAATGGFTFPTTNQPATGATSSLFGTTQPTATAAPLFGAQPASTAAAAAVTTPLFGSSQPTAAPTTTSLFGTTQQPTNLPSTTLFGTTQPTTAAAATTIPLIGTSQPTATTTTSFGTAQPTAATTAAPTLNFGTTSAPPATAPAASSSGFTFGATPATSTATQPTTAAFGFGTGTTTAPVTTSAPSTFGLPFGIPKTTIGTATTLPTATLTSTAPTTATVTTGGLGGFHPVTTTDPALLSSASGVGTTGAGMTAEERTVKEAPLPIELLELINDLEAFKKSEMNQLAELSLESEKSLEQVTEKCESVRAKLINASNLIHRQLINCNALSAEIEKDRKDAEMAKITLETPASLQQSHNLPAQYFFRLVQSFEAKMTFFQNEIIKAEAALKSLQNPTPLTAADLHSALKASKDTLIFLAAKVKTLHEAVVHEVEAHRHLLKFANGDVSVDIFTDRWRNLQAQQPRGPTSATNEKSADYLSKSNILFPSNFLQQQQASTNKYSFEDGFNQNQRSTSAQRILHSTQAPISNANLSHANLGRSFDGGTTYNVSGYGQSLFQPPSSPIYPSYIMSPAAAEAAAGASLKRIKH